MSEDVQVSYIWPRDVMGAISGLRTSAVVDLLLVDRARIDVLAATREQLAKELQRAAEPWAAVPHMGDCAFRESDFNGYCLKIVCVWAPSTHVVELQGGPADGELIELATIGDALRMPLPADPVWLADTHHPSARSDIAITYELAGWSEGARRWIYRPC